MVSQVRVPLRPGSDGDATHRPTDPARKEAEPTIYLEKLAPLWMKARGEANPHVTYVLERLPAGYAMFQKPRSSDPKHVDKWLYGHPEHKVFDSPNRFFPHFKYLMENSGSNIGCPCDVCRPIPRSSSARRSSVSSASTPKSKSHPSRPSSSGSSVINAVAEPKIPLTGSAGGNSTNAFISSAPKPPGKPLGRPPGRPPNTVLPGSNTHRVDEEGTPDIYRNLIDRLRNQGTLDEQIEEPMSPDWIAEQASMPEVLATLKNKPQWEPRRGEIVLFFREVPQGYEACWTPAGEFQFYDAATESCNGFPTWEAGFVSQTPMEDVEVDDLISETEKKTSVSSSGIRVEPLPDINDSDKSSSKQYCYVPLHHTRPFAFWGEYLNPIPRFIWHPTITHALTAMACFSLMGNHRFRGTWPSAQVYAHGIYIGSDFYTAGDTVRLLPRAGQREAEDVMTITSIRLHLSSLDMASDNDYDEGRPYNSIIFIYGKAYTTDANRSEHSWQTVANSDLPAVLQSYHSEDDEQSQSQGDEKIWYPMHPPNKEMQIPFTRILSRLYESSAMTRWFPHLPPSYPALDMGRDSLKEGRQMAQQNDRRIVNTEPLGSNWYWGNSRAEALDLETVAGIEVGKFDEERDVREWRSMLRVIEKAEVERRNLTIRGREEEGSSGGRAAVRGWGRRGRRGYGGSVGRGGSGMVRGKDVVEVSSGDDQDEELDTEDEEIRKSMKIISHGDGTDERNEAKKKGRVQVIID